MKKLVAALLFALLSSVCHAGAWPVMRDPRPGWLASPDYAMDVVWTRSASSSSFVFGGACRLFFADNTEKSMSEADAQVRRCAAQSDFQKIPMSSAAPPLGAKRVHIYVVDTPLTVAQRWEELFEPSVLISAGFYHVADDGVCRIVVNRYRSAMGHELKHCFDGAWHR